MNLTWIDVADTAIKIGLGSLITAFSAYFAFIRTQEGEALKERKIRFYRALENKTEICVDFLAQSHSLVQAHLFTSCTCNTEEYNNYLKIFSELQIKSNGELRKAANDLLAAVNQFIIINKNGIEVELSRSLRAAFNEKAGYFQHIAQLESAKEFDA